MFRFLGITLVLCLGGQPSFGDDSQKVLGSWKLVSYETEVQATGEKEPAMGQNLTGEARKPAKTSQERAELFATLIAYTGTYRIEGDKWTTKVEVAWIPEWVGTEQARSLTVDGDQLQAGE